MAIMDSTPGHRFSVTATFISALRALNRPKEVA